MPAAAVPAVDKTDLAKASTDKAPVTEAAKPAVENLEQTAKIEALEKKIADLEETINHLQQAPVKGAEEKAPAHETKESSTENGEEPAQNEPKKSASVHHHATAARHVAGSGWVLKGAKPGMAWVSQKGSSKIRTVTVGQSLPGIGKIKAIVKDSIGYWAVSGTQGRISQ